MDEAPPKPFLKSKIWGLGSQAIVNVPVSPPNSSMPPITSGADSRPKLQPQNIQPPELFLGRLPVVPELLDQNAGLRPYSRSLGRL
jgi:hypothetical protein